MKKSNSENGGREKKSSRGDVVVFTDGSGSAGDYGASAFVILNFKQTEILHMGCEFLEECTSNQAEMYAVILALRWLEKSNKRVNKITVYSDSKYVVNGFTEWSNTWEKKKWNVEVKNKELWKELCEYKKKPVTLRWVKGHSSSKWNILADFLAARCKQSGFNETKTLKNEDA